MTRVSLYSDQPMLAKGLEAVFAATERLQLDGCFFGLPELMARLESDVPDILLLDVTPEVNLGVLSDIKRVARESKIVLWVNVISTEMAFQAIGMGMRGILRKNLPIELQVSCLRQVQEGQLWFEKSLTDSFRAAKRVALSRREGQLITLLSHGLKNKEIGFKLQISEGTVKVYLSRLFEKLEVKDRFELALVGLKNVTVGSTAKPNPLNGAPVPYLRSLMLARPMHLGQV
jgi:two-component system, NarL family, nitrate/nitrite response regulator NarL